MSVEITFKNRTTKIEKVEINIDGNLHVYTGKKAKEIAKMSNSDMPGIKNFIESLE